MSTSGLRPKASSAGRGARNPQERSRLLFLAPADTQSLAATMRRLAHPHSRPFAAIWLHNSGQPLAQLVLPGEAAPDPVGIGDLWKALDHVLAVWLKSDSGSLRELQHGEFSFLFERGHHLTLVVLLRGRPAEGLRSELRNAVRGFEARHGGRLDTPEAAGSLAESALATLDDVLSPRI